MKTFGVTLILLCAGLAAAVSVARPASTAGTLTGNVGPGFSITLTQNGTKVTHLDAGDYTITVTDQSAEHNFHLSGPGVDQATDVAGTGTSTWNVTLQDGIYFFQCDVHASTMHGTFAVGTATLPTTTTATPPPALTAHAAIKALHRKITATGTTSRAASIDLTLLRGTKRVAHKVVSGAKSATLHFTATSAGRYTAKVVAKAGGSTARASASVTVK